jgi:murein DD-endopeptidase MepM/ murein hydrolase activator NlpD
LKAPNGASRIDFSPRVIEVFRMSQIRRGLIALGCAVTLLAAVGPPVFAEPDPDRLERIRQEIEAKREKIEAAEEESASIEEQLADAQQDRRALSAEIEVLEIDLAEAQAELAEVEGVLDHTRAELHDWTTKLDRARDDLRAQQELLDQRAATAYKVGPSAYLEVLLGSDDLSTLTDRVTFIEEILTVDSDVLAGVEVARQLVVERQDQVQAISARVAEQFRKVEERTQEIAELYAQQQDLLAQVDLEITVQTESLQSLEEARQQYEDQVAALEAESARLTGVIQGTGSSGSGQYNGILGWPADGPIVSGFGYRTHPVYGTTRFHSGVDIGAACGQPIWAAESGTVISAGYNGGYGNATIIDHGDGLATLYAHQSSIAVGSGQQVSRGAQIGSVGTTGLSTGCHLHFEVRVNGEPVDPVPYIT